MPEKTKEQRIRELEIQVSELYKAKEETRKLKIENLQLAQNMQVLANTIVNIQPILGRLIAAITVMEQKGLFNGRELAAVSEKEAQSFLEAARGETLVKVSRGPVATGTVASNSGNGNAGVSGTPSSGGDAPSASSDGQSAGIESRGLSEVRATHDASSGPDSPSANPPKDVPVGSVGEARSRGDTIRTRGGR